ncbi:MAG: hypothetical protein CMO55_16975 [Verrucomicrobiales bacterium]|nr:hypothetical protein [Verrucomicrobiales bacterium]
MSLSAYDEGGRRKYLSLAEGKRFIERSCVLPLREQLFCKLLYFSGCRISEALSLTLNDIDFEENYLRVRTLKQRSKATVRRIPVPQELAKKLEENATDDGKLWNFSRTTAWREVKLVMLVSEIYGPQASPKGLRHGFGVRCALAGIPVTQIQDWMGHSSVETTAIYLDVRDGEERELMSRTWNFIEK